MGLQGLLNCFFPFWAWRWVGSPEEVPLQQFRMGGADSKASLLLLVYRPTHQLGSEKPPTANVATQRYIVHKGATHTRGLPDYSTELLIALPQTHHVLDPLAMLR